jgi:hypothetical protein
MWFPLPSGEGAAKRRVSIVRQLRCLVSKKELRERRGYPIKKGVLREAKIEYPMEFSYPWVSMIPESGDGITGWKSKDHFPD